MLCERKEKLLGRRLEEGIGLLQPPLSVGTAVDKVRVVERQLDSTVDNVVCGLHTEHEGVVLVADLVLPATETATGVDVLGLQLGQELSQDTVTLNGGRRVTVVELAVVGRDDLVLGQDHLSVDKTLDTILEQVLLVHGLHARLGNLQHDGPVGTLLGLGGVGLAAIGLVESRQLSILLGLVVGGVVGEDGGAVEGAVVLGEVQPALVTDTVGTGTTQANTDNVCGREVETLGQSHELVVAHLLNKLVNVHGGNELLVANLGAVAEGDGLLVGIHAGNRTLLAEAHLLLGQSVGNGDPDATSTVASRETEGGIGAPVTCCLVQDDVLGNKLDVGSSDTLAEPVGAHLEFLLAMSISSTKKVGGDSIRTLVVGTAHTL